MRSSGTELRRQQEFRFHCQTPLCSAREFLLLWPGIINLCLCCSRHSPGPVPGELLGWVVLQTWTGAHRGTERLPETLMLYSWGVFCNLNALTQVNIWCKHLTFPYSPATRMRTSGHAFKHFADKNMLFQKHLPHSLPATKNLFLYLQE